MGNCVKFDADKFRAMFPEFSDKSVWTDERLEMSFDEATCYIWPCGWAGLNGKCQQQALYMMVAHLSTLTANMLSGSSSQCGDTQGGIVTAATINKISVTMLAPPVSNSWEYWLAQSPYGVRLWAMLRIKARGGMYAGAGATSERSGFRKGGGVFW